MTSEFLSPLKHLALVGGVRVLSFYQPWDTHQEAWGISVFLTTYQEKGLLELPTWQHQSPNLKKMAYTVNINVTLAHIVGVSGPQVPLMHKTVDFLPTLPSIRSFQIYSGIINHLYMLLNLYLIHRENVHVLSYYLSFPLICEFLIRQELIHFGP